LLLPLSVINLSVVLMFIPSFGPNSRSVANERNSKTTKTSEQSSEFFVSNRTQPRDRRLEWLQATFAIFNTEDTGR